MSSHTMVLRSFSREKLMLGKKIGIPKRPQKDYLVDKQIEVTDHINFASHACRQINPFNFELSQIEEPVRIVVSYHCITPNFKQNRTAILRRITCCEIDATFCFACLTIDIFHESEEDKKQFNYRIQFLGTFLK